MKPFLDENFLLQSRTAETLFHEYAVSMPIFDYHCHLPPDRLRRIISGITWVRFGWASGALAATLLTDYAQPADEEQLWSIWEGNARVKR